MQVRFISLALHLRWYHKNNEQGGLQSTQVEASISDLLANPTFRFAKLLVLKSSIQPTILLYNLVTKF